MGTREPGRGPGLPFDVGPSMSDRLRFLLFELSKAVPDGPAKDLEFFEFSVRFFEGYKLWDEEISILELLWHAPQVSRGGWPGACMPSARAGAMGGTARRWLYILKCDIICIHLMC